MTRTVWSTRLPAIALAQIDTFVKNPMTLQLGLRGLFINCRTRQRPVSAAKPLRP